MLFYHDLSKMFLFGVNSGALQSCIPGGRVLPRVGADAGGIASPRPCESGINLPTGGDFP